MNFSTLLPTWGQAKMRACQTQGQGKGKEEGLRNGAALRLILALSPTLALAQNVARGQNEEVQSMLYVNSTNALQGF